MKNENLYKLIFKMALTYRLSLKNICILLGKEENENNQLEIYNMCLYLFGNNLDLRIAYDFLFNYETINEPEKISKRSLTLASLFLSQYKEAAKSGNKEKLRKVYSSLTEIDNKFLKLKDREIQSTVTEEETLIIAKYRLKYCISQKKISEYLDVQRRTLIMKEKNIEDEILSYKLNLLSNYHFDIVSNDKRNRK